MKREDSAASEYDRHLASKLHCPRCRGAIEALDTCWKCIQCGYRLTVIDVAKQSDHHSSFEERCRWKNEMGRYRLYGSAVNYTIEAAGYSKIIALVHAILHPISSARLGRAYYIADTFRHLVDRSADDKKMEAISAIVGIAKLRDGDSIQYPLLLLLYRRSQKSIELQSVTQ
jgi:hypothetical protein